ncbi:MAG: RagB/SusD family nutrient uptake outer membrane protein, partial [Spirosomataceae bacterium]
VVDNTENETRAWKDKMYYRPISRDEMNRNSKLIQNPGY